QQSSQKFSGFRSKNVLQACTSPKVGSWPVASPRQTRVHSGLGRPLLAGIESQPVYLNDSTGQPDFPNLLLNLGRPTTADQSSFLRDSAGRKRLPLAFRRPDHPATSSIGIATAFVGIDDFFETRPDFFKQT